MSESTAVDLAAFTAYLLDIPYDQIEQVREAMGKPIEPWRDFPGLIAFLLERRYTRNPCRENCTDEAGHEHLRHPEEGDLIVWADGHWSSHDLTQPAPHIYPVYRPQRGVPQGWRYSGEVQGACYRLASGSAVHVKPGCQCIGAA